MSSNGDPKPGLAWPDHDTGPTPPPNYRDPRLERPTRRPMQFWDRIKWLLLLGGVWLFMFWSVLAANPGQPRNVVFVHSVRAYGWILAVAGIELLRQLHYLISEQSPGWHHLWTEGVFGGFTRWSMRYNDWTRFRIARFIKWLFMLLILDLIIAKVRGTHPATALFELPVMLISALPFMMQILFLFFVMIIQVGGLFWFLSRGGVEVYFPEDIKTRFSDVWGQDAVLERVKENIIHLEDPEAIEDKGGYVPGGILLWGPPGTGKTLIAEAVAGETGRPFVLVDTGSFNAMFMGVGIMKVRALFRKLRKLALRYGGVIAFFDEADSLGNRGAMAGAGGGDWRPMADARFTGRCCSGMSYLTEASASLVFRASLGESEADRDDRRRSRMMMMGGGGGMGTLQALLTQMSGLKKPRGLYNRVIRKALGMRPKPPPKYRLLIMMATNMPQALDDALLRPGRIDRIYKVGYPSKAGRTRTYEGYLAKVRHDLTREEVDKLATITPYATGATIKDLVNEALIQSIRGGREWITWKDIIKAKLLKDLGPAEDVEYIERERHAVALHEACHAVVAYRVRHHMAIDIATIEKGSTYLGMVASIPLEEQFTQWRTEYEADIMVCLASLVGEKIFFEADNSSGVSGDLHTATTLAMFMEGYWGMGSTIGSHNVSKRKQGWASSEGGRDLLESRLGVRVEQLLRGVLEKTQTLIEQSRREILAVTHALETYKTLTGDDVEAVIKGEQGPLIDGRPYMTDAFLEQAEAYHLLAVEAHRGHGKVDAPLPVLANGQVSVSTYPQPDP